MLATWSEVIFTNLADGTAVASTDAEATLLTGLNLQPVFPAFSLLDNGRGAGKAFHVYAAGSFSNTGTPTMQFTARLGETAGASFLTGAVFAISPAITGQSGVSNKQWELDLYTRVQTAGIGTTTMSLVTSGNVRSFGGFASPFYYAMQQATPESDTWTEAVNGGVNLYMNLLLTWGTNSASNTAKLKTLVVTVLN